ncbi:MAG: hypothetical protein C0502_04100 [Opitutus sp.]|nr:hypothetical protein [Opitutus sp.]
MEQQGRGYRRAAIIESLPLRFSAAVDAPFKSVSRDFSAQLRSEQDGDWATEGAKVAEGCRRLLRLLCFLWLIDPAG